MKPRAVTRLQRERAFWIMTIPSALPPIPDSVHSMRTQLENIFYYLDNFEFVLRWLAERHSDLLRADERRFLQRFPALPRPSRALLVRMVMRRGELFRLDRLDYAEIGSARDALIALVQEGWVDDAPQLEAAQLCGLLSKKDLLLCFSQLDAGLHKHELQQGLAERHPAALAAQQWSPTLAGMICRLTLRPLCDRLRLLFFGNLRQDWTEFVLSELGVVRYETVDFSPAARGFATRNDVDTWLQLYQCREQLQAGDGDGMEQGLPREPLANRWLESRRLRLLFELGQHYERRGEPAQALRVYADCPWPAARVRHIRCLELTGAGQQALALALQAAATPHSEAESQQLRRMLPRLQRNAGFKPVRPAPAPDTRTVPLLHLCLPLPTLPTAVETVCCDHLQQDGSRVFYVENTLFNALFGLLCWQAIFAPLPGAFFHPFHAAPADLYHPDFQQRRAAAFADCLQQLHSDAWHATIRCNYRLKHGLQNAFVSWEQLDDTLLELALSCIPPQHLHLIFERMLADLRAHRSGLPDLIQFWPQQQHYRLLEIKGPGDRVQDNQQRWLDYCLRWNMPVALCHVSWQDVA